MAGLMTLIGAGGAVGVGVVTIAAVLVALAIGGRRWR